MKFIPILFSTEMVQAILAGNKTQTRRVIKLADGNNPDETDIPYFEDGTPENYVMDFSKHYPKWKRFDCPYGKVGDVLWVRETTKVGAWNDEECKAAFDYKASPELVNTPWCFFEDDERFMNFQEKLITKLDKLGIEPTVDESQERFYYNWKPGKSPFKWTPGIHMIKEACRIFLKIKNVRIEQLNSISDNDAVSEGITVLKGNTSEFYMDYLLPSETSGFVFAHSGFESLWKKINGHDSWNANPWVWVIEFERIEKPEIFC